MNCAVHAQQGNIEQVLKEYGLCGNEHTQVVLLHINKTLHSYLTRTYFKKNLHLHSKVISNKCSKSTGCAAMKIHKLCHTFRFTTKALARKIAKWISAKMLWCVSTNLALPTYLYCVRDRETEIKSTCASDFSWWVLQHCTGFAWLVWGRSRVHRAFVYSDWFECYVCVCSLLPRLTLLLSFLWTFCTAPPARWECL